MPNFVTRLFKSFRTKAVSIVGTHSFSGLENYNDSYNLATYKDSLYLYIGVNMIAKRVAGIPLQLFKIKNKTGDTEEVFSHPIISLLGNPNDRQTQREFFELSVAYYLLAGDCFWYINRGTGTKPQSFHVMRPDYVEVVLSEDRKSIVAYEYRDVTVMRFKPEDVLHFKNIDPTNQLRGVGVVRPATSRIISEKEASRYQANFFKNQGVPDVAVFVDRSLTPEEAEEARDRWKETYGRGQGGKVAFFGADVKELRPLNISPKEMDFIASQNFLRDDILASLHIPKAMVTSDDVNLSNAKEAKIMYLEEAIVPVIETFIDVINHKLIPSVDESVFLSYEDPVPTDREILLKETTAGFGRWLSRNEARQLYGYDEVEGGDEFPSSGQSPGMAQEIKQQARRILKARPALYLKLNAIEAVSKVLSLPAVKREMNSIFPTKAMKQSYAKAFNDKRDRKAATFEQAINDFHAGQLERIIKQNAEGFDPARFMDQGEEKRLARGQILPLAERLYREAGQDTLTGLLNPEKAAKSAENFFVDAVLMAAIEARVELFSDSVITTTYEVLRTVILEGVENGDGIDKIGRSIREYYDDMSVRRAKTIAQTETGFILSKATDDAYQQSNVVTGKEWITVGDSLVRPEHQDNDGVIVAKDAAFPNGEHYPAQHSINCRCTIAPAV